MPMPAKIPLQNENKVKPSANNADENRKDKNDSSTNNRFVAQNPLLAKGIYE